LDIGSGRKIMASYETFHIATSVKSNRGQWFTFASFNKINKKIYRSFLKGGAVDIGRTTKKKKPKTMVSSSSSSNS
jgi:hypothetical protein